MTDQKSLGIFDGVADVAGFEAEAAAVRHTPGLRAVTGDHGVGVAPGQARRHKRKTQQPAAGIPYGNSSEYVSGIWCPAEDFLLKSTFAYSRSF